jgi:hypothetical protein
MWLGLSTAAWEAIGTWFAGIATLFTAIVALWIAQRGDAVRVKLVGTVAQILGNPKIPVERKHLLISVTNLGRHAVRLNTIGWRTGLLHYKSPWLGRKYAVQIVMPPDGPQLPLKLEHAENATWMIPLDDWIKENADRLVPKPYWLGLATLRIQASMSTGETITAKLAASVVEDIKRRLCQ